jgi:hypothetical protein
MGALQSPNCFTWAGRQEYILTYQDGEGIYILQEQHSSSSNWPARRESLSIIDINKID